MAKYGNYEDEFVREFMIAAHKDLEAVQATLAKHPDLLNVRYEWEDGSIETPLGAASHVGNRPIAEYLLEQGAPLTISTAAMLGRVDDVARMLEEDPAKANATGSHGIPLMLHVALGGSVEIAQKVVDHEGGGEVPMRILLHIATARGERDLVEWALDQGLDPHVKNLEGKTPLQVAEERGHEEIVALLRGGGE